MKTVNRMIMTGFVVSSIMLNPIFSMEKNDAPESKEPKLSMFQKLQGAASSLGTSFKARSIAMTAEAKARITACTQKAHEIVKKNAIVIAETAKVVIQNKHVRNIAASTESGALGGAAFGAAAMGVRGVPFTVQKRLYSGFVACGAMTGLVYGIAGEAYPELRKMLLAAAEPSPATTSSTTTVQASSSSSSSSSANETDVAEEDNDRKSFKDTLDIYRDVCQELERRERLKDDDKTFLQNALTILDRLVNNQPLFSQENNVEGLKQQLEVLLAKANGQQKQRPEVILPVESGISDANDEPIAAATAQNQLPSSSSSPTVVVAPVTQSVVVDAEKQALEVFSKTMVNELVSEAIANAAHAHTVAEEQRQQEAHDAVAAALQEVVTRATQLVAQPQPVADNASNAMVDEQPQPVVPQVTPAAAVVAQPANKKRRRNEAELLRNGTPETNILNTPNNPRTTRSQQAKKAKITKNNPNTTTH